MVCYVAYFGGNSRPSIDPPQVGWLFDCMLVGASFVSLVTETLTNPESLKIENNEEYMRHKTDDREINDEPKVMI